MERVAVDGRELAYLEAGEGPETVVFSHSYLVDHRHFAAQIDAFAETHRVIAYDHRDHGESDRATSPYSVDDLVLDAERLLDALAVGPCHWVGLSAGGFVGMRLALRTPGRLRSLALLATSGRSHAWLDRAKNWALLAAVRAVGIRPVLPAAMRALFGPTFLADPERDDEVQLWRARILANDARAVLRFGDAVLARDDVLDELRDLDIPTLVLAGAEDRALPVACARALADAIPGAQLAVLENTGHLCTVERPAAVSELLVPFVRGC